MGKKVGEKLDAIQREIDSKKEEDNYISIIIQKSHPYYNEIMSAFNNEIQTFSESR